MKHTPGPWIVNVWTTGRHTIESIDIGHPIAEIHEMHNDEQRANAQLIASAPELLKACKRLCGFCGNEAFDRAVKESKQIIAKVEKN